MALCQLSAAARPARSRAARSTRGPPPRAPPGPTCVWRGECVSRRPEPFAVTEVITRYFHEDGHTSSGLERKREARYVAYEEDEVITAQKLMARIGLAARELDRLTLVDDALNRSLVLSSGEIRTPIDAKELYLDLFNVDGETHSRRIVTVSGLVGATNRVLFQRELQYRIVPIVAPESLEAYVGVSAQGAGILDAAGMLETTGSELSHFTYWSPAEFDCALSSVA